MVILLLLGWFNRLKIGNLLKSFGDIQYKNIYPSNKSNNKKNPHHFGQGLFG